MPQPDLVLLLDAPTATLQARKQEVPFAETERQAAAYRQLAESLPHAWVIDASRPFDAVVADARRIIVDHVAARTEWRLLKLRGSQ
jgi:thymidylate kinase